MSQLRVYVQGEMSLLSKFVDIIYGSKKSSKEKESSYHFIHSSKGYIIKGANMDD